MRSAALMVVTKIVVMPIVVMPIVVILYASAALAEDHPWIDAKVIDITSESRVAGVLPVASLVGAPTTKTFYWIQTDDSIYVLGPAVSKRQLLNLTLHGPTKIALDGKYAHLLDDYGMDRKLPVVEEVKRPKAK
jgi:hypothetical protein